MQTLQIRPHKATAAVHYLYTQIQWLDTTGEHLQEKCTVTHHKKKVQMVQ